MRQRLAHISLFLMLVSSCVAATAQETKTPQSIAVPRIRTLAEWAPAFSDPSSPVVKVAPELAEQSLGVFGKQPDPKTLREVAARLFEYEWKTGDAGHPNRLVLTANRSRQLLPEKLRTEMARKGQEALRRRMTAIRDVLTGKTPPEQFASQYPDDARNLELPAAGRFTAVDLDPSRGSIKKPTKERLSILRLLSDADIDTLIREGVWISATPDKGTPLGDYARTTFPKRGMTLRSSNGTVLQPPKDFYDDPSQDYRVILSLYGTPDLLGVRENVWNTRPAKLPRPPVNEPTAVVSPAPLSMTAVFLLQPPLTRSHRDNNPFGRELGNVLRLGNQSEEGAALSFQQALEWISRAANLSIISDFYAENNLRRFYPPRTHDPIKVADMLDRIASSFQYTWESDRGVISFRHARWPFAELGELPANSVKTITTLVARRDGLSLEEQANLAAQLSRAQFENLPAYASRFFPIRHKHNCLYIFRSLTNEQREMATSGDGLLFFKMAPDQQNAFTDVIRSEWPVLLLAPPSSRANWKVQLVRSTLPREGWHFIYVFGPERPLAIFLRDFQEMPPLAGDIVIAPSPEQHRVF